MSKQTFNAQFSQAQRRALSELMPTLVERLLLDTPNPRVVPLTLDELAAIQKLAADGMSETENGRITNSFRKIIVIVANVMEKSKSIGAIPVSQRLYQFKITLNESNPPIWRRIQVKNCTLDKLNEHIQTAMGWTNSHLHQFKIEEKLYGDPDLLDEDFDFADSTITKISEIVRKDGKRFAFLYEYDFGDSWDHEVLFEGCLRAEKGGRYPICVEGERSCPPEDVGGVWGYSEFLEAVADPAHEQHDEFAEWAGPFNPEEFDAAKTTKIMRRGLPNWRQM